MRLQLYQSTSPASPTPIHDHEEEKCYPSREAALEVEAWLHAELERLGYVVGGDLGIALVIQ